MSLGQKGLIILLLKIGSNLGPRRVILYSPIKSVGPSFQPITRSIKTVVAVAYTKRLTRPRFIAAAMDLFCFFRRRLSPERYVYCDLYLALGP